MIDTLMKKWYNIKMKSIITFVVIMLLLPTFVFAEIKNEEVFSLINNERYAYGLPALTLSEDLTKAAELKLEDMLEKDYWSHQTPEGYQPWHFLILAGYPYDYAGENLARKFSTTEGVVNGWMKSEGHKQNILSKNYTETGIATDGNIVVQFFASTKTVPEVKNAAIAPIDYSKLICKLEYVSTK